MIFKIIAGYLALSPHCYIIPVLRESTDNMNFPNFAFADFLLVYHDVITSVLFHLLSLYYSESKVEELWCRFRCRCDCIIVFLKFFKSSERVFRCERME